MCKSNKGVSTCLSLIRNSFSDYSKLPVAVAEFHH